MKLGTGLKMVDEYPWMFPMVADALNLHKKPDLIAYAKCGPTHLELEEVRRLFERMELKPSDVKTVAENLKALEGVVHSHPKDGDDAMASVFMLDSLGPLMEKDNVKKNP